MFTPFPISANPHPKAPGHLLHLAKLHGFSSFNLFCKLIPQAPSLLTLLSPSSLQFAPASAVLLSPATDKMSCFTRLCARGGAGGVHNSITLHFFVLLSKNLKALGQPPAPTGVSSVPSSGLNLHPANAQGAFPTGRDPGITLQRDGIGGPKTPGSLSKIQCPDACVGVSGTRDHGFCSLFLMHCLVFENCSSNYAICLSNSGLVPTLSFY